MSWKTLLAPLPDLIGTVLGGIFLTFLFFILREKVFPPPNISGRWFFVQKTNRSAYNPYIGMQLVYCAMLWREGNLIHGTAEKIYEDSSSGERNYVGHFRTRSTISGYIEKNYLGKDIIYLHAIEQGHGRESTNYYEVKRSSRFCCKHKMTIAFEGIFSSMVADQDGEVTWSRRHPLEL